MYCSINNWYRLVIETLLIEGYNMVEGQYMKISSEQSAFK